MSIKALNWALDLPIPPGPKLVLAVIADYADDQGYAFPGMDKIARRASVSERTAIRVINDLEANGYLRRERRHIATGQRTSNGYQLLPDGDQVTDRHVTDSTPNVTTVAVTGEPSVEPPVQPQKRASQFPPNLTWTNAHSLKASAKGVDVDVEFEKFRDYHLAKGSKFVDWDRAFHTWLNNARPGPGPGRVGSWGGGPASRPSRDAEIRDFLGGSLGLDDMKGEIER